MSLPDMLKYSPKRFWNMLKQKDSDISALKL
jgi:Reverse transcriptase (RNA-dependent DNA polymerase)